MYLYTPKNRFHPSSTLTSYYLHVSHHFKPTKGVPSDSCWLYYSGYFRRGRGLELDLREKSSIIPKRKMRRKKKKKKKVWLVYDPRIQTLQVRWDETAESSSFFPTHTYYVEILFSRQKKRHIFFFSQLFFFWNPKLYILLSQHRRGSYEKNSTTGSETKDDDYIQPPFLD